MSVSEIFTIDQLTELAELFGVSDADILASYTDRLE